MQATTVHVFVSSTWMDLQPERRAVEEVLQRLRETKFIGMEYFGSREESTRAASVSEVEKCQVYLGILGGRYGSGITESEYLRAREIDLPCFLYCKAEPQIDPQWKESDTEQIARLEAFKSQARSRHTVAEFNNPEGLAALVVTDLHRWLTESHLAPAARRAAQGELPLDQLDFLLAAVQDLNALRQEFQQRVQGASPEKPNGIIGAAGTGDLHTGDIVFQIFGNAPVTLAGYVRTQEFRTLVEERTRNFIGRDFLVQALDQLLDNPEFPSGYIVIRGEPGIGKTALASQLVKLRGYVHHFNIAAQNIRSTSDFLGNVCAQLILRYRLDHSSLPPHATRDSGFLLQLLSEVKADRKGEPLVLLVDALDEAENGGLLSGLNRLLLPPALPDGVFFILTTRDQDDYRLVVDRSRILYLDDKSPENLSDVRAYIAKFLSEHRERMIPRVSEWDLDEAGFIEALTRTSQGNFMYLVHVLRDIRDGKLTLVTVEKVGELPQGLREYYKRHWRTMRQQDQDRFERYYEPVVCLLATVREPVTIQQLVEWTRLPSARVVEVVREWREFLDEERSGGGPPLYRVYHASFQDFLQEEVGLAGYHEAIAQDALRKIPGFFGDRPF